ncbi:MAG TPA: hypothetical protein VK361_03165, partial [Rubrobacteraceae bacterium]|nr:hypothetical protein [Rubrobacteraceae bacterium]
PVRPQLPGPADVDDQRRGQRRVAVATTLERPDPPRTRLHDAPDLEVTPSAKPGPDQRAAVVSGR